MLKMRKAASVLNYFLSFSTNNLHNFAGYEKNLTDYADVLLSISVVVLDGSED